MSATISIDTAVAKHRSGDIEAACALYEGLLRQNPSDAAALHQLGLARMQQGRTAEAETLLQRALTFDPQHANRLADLGAIKSMLGKADAARELLLRALDLAPTHPDALKNLGTMLVRLRRHSEAIPYLEQLLQQQPAAAEVASELALARFRNGEVDPAIALLLEALRQQPLFATARLRLGEILESIGQFRQAHTQYLLVLDVEPDNVTALSRLLQLRGVSLDIAWVRRAERLLAESKLSQALQVRLRVALGHYFDQQRQYDAAFEHFARGYKIRRAHEPFDSAAYSAAVDALIEVFTPALFASLPKPSIPTGRPILIVGMPRSGTTLIEQILASHPDVIGGGELRALMATAYRMHTLGRDIRPYPQGMHGVDGVTLTTMSQQYLRHLEIIDATAPRVTDKMPFNFMHLGLVAALLPEATIIHCRRDPLDTCLSCYFVSFADSFPFANDLATLGRYYRDYRRLMKHWESVLPTPILHVQYEEVVHDLESSVRRILDHCGLTFNDACVRFHETQRDVRTPSRWQVRQPIYTASIGRWKHYRRHLAPLLAALGDAVDEPHIDEK